MLLTIFFGAMNDRGVNAVSITLNESIVLFGHDVNFRSADTFDLIILVAKVFIYKCKVKKIIAQFLSFFFFLNSILAILLKYINTTPK